ncbi:uroporphyrinogen-III C-methyltransferase [Echinicola sp. CAU 1574]|uniref:uroporphyrinogen-III C-methyltransferase n=1 Tax=Echinicola arenosa TaxID=2774144 RepID=A0ABR9AI17_9BACT|nr:uroporphyrinogen-III C-methyltransferase [Echinicola arenosa]MBD8487982.1 uroporphyrinogen-III C-methyltransferase [Echinicola arenosa]
MKNISNQLSIVGAGPGDPDLITLKAIKVLKTADVVLYDALANEALLEYVPVTAVKVFVGKRAGMHYRQQREINKMIVNYAKTFGHVVRLKGGDPYVFGRGHEEMEYAAQHGLDTQYVPGISSAMAVPGLSGIPLTKRGVNESFWIVTGTLKDHSTAKDLYFAAQSSATVIVLMGVKKLPEIVNLFKEHRGGEEAIALIQNGSKEDERSIVGNLGSIMDIQAKEKIAAPAIIVIGAVVREKGKQLGSFLEEKAVVSAR